MDIAYIGKCKPVYILILFLAGFLLPSCDDEEISPGCWGAPCSSDEECFSPFICDDGLCRFAEGSYLPGLDTSEMQGGDSAVVECHLTGNCTENSRLGGRGGWHMCGNEALAIESARPQVNGVVLFDEDPGPGAQVQFLLFPRGEYGKASIETAQAYQTASNPKEEILYQGIPYQSLYKWKESSPDKLLYLMRARSKSTGPWTYCDFEGNIAGRSVAVPGVLIMNWKQSLHDEGGYCTFDEANLVRYASVGELVGFYATLDDANFIGDTEMDREAELCVAEESWKVPCECKNAEIGIGEWWDLNIHATHRFTRKGVYYASFYQIHYYTPWGSDEENWDGGFCDSDGSNNGIDENKFWKIIVD